MNKSVPFLLAVSILAVLLSSGCVLPEMNAVEIARADPVAANFLALHPNAEIDQVIAWTSAESQGRISELREKCGYKVLPTDYFYISLLDGGAQLEAWVFQKTMKVACIHRSDDQCVSNADCEDGILCTTDVCQGTPKACVKERIKQCSGGDGCCPSGCSFIVDYDCQEDECLTAGDCSDFNASTNDFCSGLPRKCSYETITTCANDDGYCPKECNFGTDNDCTVGECEVDADCNDEDASTKDTCEGIPKLCRNQAAKECISNDDYCPPTCNYRTDSDCAAASGNQERITVTCNDSATNVDNDLKNYGNELKASFGNPVTHTNNDTLKYYKYRNYKYNGMETKNTGQETGLNTSIVERITINGRAVYDKAEMKNLLYFNKNGLEYEVDLLSGIPATETETNLVPFEAGNKDTITIVLFGKDAFVRYVNQNEGEEQVQLLSNYTELSVINRGSAMNLKGKTRETYMMTVSRCDEASAVFSLYNGDKLVAGQEARTGDILFTEHLEKATMLTYLNRDYSSGRCEFRYATGTQLEEIHHNMEFPVGSGSPWKSYLEFENNKLMNISFRLENGSEEKVLDAGESIEILPIGETDGKGFCTLKFVGLIK